MADIIDGGCPRCGGHLYESKKTEDEHVYRCLFCDQGSSHPDATGDAEASGRPAKGAPRKEWDKFAAAQGLDPSQYGTKDELIAALTS